MANSAISADGQKRRFALLSPAGYGERYADGDKEPILSLPRHCR